MTEVEQEYTNMFQRLLLAHIVKDETMFEAAEPVRLDDFEVVPCQVVLEAVRMGHSKTGKLPDTDSLAMVAAEVALNADGRYQSFLRAEEHQALADLIGWLDRTAPTSTDYFVKELPRFIKGIRAAKILDASRNESVTGSAADGVIGKLKALEDAVEKEFSKEEIPFVTPAQNPGLFNKNDWVPPISTGLPSLDKFLSGGPSRKEVCLISAPSGVGKTNVLIHLLVAASYARIHGLGFSLELPGRKMLGRASAMVAGIDAEWLKKPVELWDEDPLRRVSVATTSNPVMERISFLDYSSNKPTLTEIEKRIAQWKAGLRAKGVPEEDIGIVCIDWIDYVSVPFAKKMEDWERYILVAQELGFIARRHNVLIWIANQTTKEAEAKKILRMQDTARGYHLNDAMDLSIGVNLAEESRITEENTGEGMRGRRWLNFSIAKNRNGDLGRVPLFRAPSLRMFDNEAAYNAYQRRLAEVDLAAGAILTPEHAQSIILAQMKGMFAQETIA